MARIFTPRIIEGTYPGKTMTDGRAVMSLGAEDRRRYDEMPRYPEVDPIKVTDLNTNTQWWVRPADCGADCFCAAEAKGA